MGLSADFIFNALQLSRVFFGGRLADLPSPAVAKWILLVFVVDDASANRRVIAFIATWARKLRVRVLIVAVKCLAHQCHRAAVPVLEYFKLSGPLFRAAHCMMQAPYWLTLCRSVLSHVRRFIVPVHHIDPHAGHRAVADDILDLTCSQK